MYCAAWKETLQLPSTHVPDPSRQMPGIIPVRGSRIPADSHVSEAPRLHAGGQKVKARPQCAPIDRKPVVLRLENVAAADPPNLMSHSRLISERSDVADDRIRVDHVERLVGVARQVAGI